MSVLLFLWWWVGCFLAVFPLNLIHFLFEVATGMAVIMSFIYVHMYTSLLYAACFNRRDGSSAGKKKCLTQAAGATQLGGVSGHTKFQPSRRMSAVTSSCRTPDPKDAMLTWCLLFLADSGDRKGPDTAELVCDRRSLLKRVTLLCRILLPFFGRNFAPNKRVHYHISISRSPWKTTL